MSSFEWMELQTLTAEISAARSRLVAARSSKNVGRARALAEEIGAVEARRSQLLAHISTNLAGSADQPSAASAKKDPEVVRPLLPRNAAEEEESGAESQVGVVADVFTAPALTSDQGDERRIRWERLTPADLARATGELDGRRAEMLQRHAAELHDLAAEQREVESLEAAVNAFVQSFGRPLPGGEIAASNDEGDLPMRAHG